MDVSLASVMGPPVRQWHGTACWVLGVGVVRFAGLVVGVTGAGVGAGSGGLLALPVGLAVEHELVGGGLEPVDGRLREERS